MCIYIYIYIFIKFIKTGCYYKYHFSNYILIVALIITDFIFCLSKEKRSGTTSDILNKGSCESRILHNHCSDNEEPNSCKLNIEFWINRSG